METGSHSISHSICGRRCPSATPSCSHWHMVAHVLGFHALNHWAILPVCPTEKQIPFWMLHSEYRKRLDQGSVTLLSPGCPVLVITLCHRKHLESLPHSHLLSSLSHGRNGIYKWFFHSVSCSSKPFLVSTPVGPALVQDSVFSTANAI